MRSGPNSPFKRHVNNAKMQQQQQITMAEMSDQSLIHDSSDLPKREKLFFETIGLVQCNMQCDMRCNEDGMKRSKTQTANEMPLIDLRIRSTNILMEEARRAWKRLTRC